MIVVADTGPLNYLILIERVTVLPAIYNHVVVPPAVAGELASSAAPSVVRSWIMNPPIWLEIRTPGRSDPRLDPMLDSGETEAITLAQNSGPDAILLIDDLPGRHQAARLGLQMIGTLGLFKEAHNRGLLHLSEVLGLLKQTNFRVSADVWRKFTDTT